MALCTMASSKPHLKMPLDKLKPFCKPRPNYVGNSYNFRYANALQKITWIFIKERNTQMLSHLQINTDRKYIIGMG